MRKQLFFYTLWALFVATSIVTLGGLIGQIPVKEPYLGALVTAFLVELATVVWGMVKGTDFWKDDAPSNTPRQIGNAPFNPEKIAQIFWFGGDLHSLLFHLTATGDVKSIRFYLKQVNSHMGESGLKDHPLKGVMERLYREGRSRKEGDWTPALRQQYAHAVRDLMTKVVALIEQQQGPSFVGEVPDSP